MNADRVYIFHTADGDCVISRVTHNLKLNLLISADALFDKNLMNRGELERIETNLNKLFLVICKAAARTAERKRRTENNGVTDSFSRRLCLVE